MKRICLFFLLSLIITVQSNATTHLSLREQLINQALTRGGTDFDRMVIEARPIDTDVAVGLTSISFRHDLCEFQADLLQSSQCPNDGQTQSCQSFLELDGLFYELTGTLDFFNGPLLIQPAPGVTNCRLASGNALPAFQFPTLLFGVFSINIDLDSFQMETQNGLSIFRLNSNVGDDVVCDGNVPDPTGGGGGGGNPGDLIFSNGFEGVTR